MILVDRGISSSSPMEIIRVGVLFIRGADDVESLPYDARMVQHEKVELTVSRYMLFGIANTKERRKETNLIDEFR